MEHNFLSPEDNDLLSYIVHRSRKAVILDTTEVFETYRGLTETLFTVEELKIKVQKDLLPKINNFRLLSRTKAKLLYSTQNLHDNKLIRSLANSGVIFGRNALLGAIETITVAGETFNIAKLNEVEPNLLETLQIETQGRPNAWSPDEINDALLYIVEYSRTATERLVSDTVCQDYLKDSGISRDVEALEVGFRRIIAPKIESANILLKTKAATCFATKIPVTAEFLRFLSINSIQVSSSIKITKYKRRSYIYRNPDRPSISKCSNWPAKHENAMMDYLEDEDLEMDLKNVWKNFENEYFQKNSWRETFHPSAEKIGIHFSESMKSKICTLGDRYDLNTLARMCLASSAPIDEGFLQKLQKHADANDIILEYIRSIDSTPIKSDNADLYDFSDYQNLDLLSGVNTWTEVEDNDILGYISFRAGNGTKLNMDSVFVEYKDFSKSSRSVEELKKRFASFLASRIEGSMYLPLARAKMLYATETPISAEFRANLLNKFDINTDIDGQRKILRMFGAHVVPARVAPTRSAPRLDPENLNVPGRTNFVINVQRRP